MLDIKNKGIIKFMIVVSMTSWKGRITTAGRAIYWFYTRQTIKPDVFYFTLAEEEFPNKEKDLPPDLLLLISSFKVELNWVKRNIYAHKKYEVFKKYANDSVFLIDDDILYPPDHIEKLLELSKRNNDKCICCYYTATENYIHKKRNHTAFEFNEPSLRNALLSGLAYFPPNILKSDLFKNEQLRDKFCQKCDDSWIKAWCVKNDIPIVGYKLWIGGKCLMTIDNTQEQSIWATFNSKTHNSINQKTLNFINAIHALDIKNKVLEIWPEFY